MYRARDRVNKGGIPAGILDRPYTQKHGYRRATLIEPNRPSHSLVRDTSGDRKNIEADMDTAETLEMEMDADADMENTEEAQGLDTDMSVDKHHGRYLSGQGKVAPAAVVKNYNRNRFASLPPSDEPSSSSEDEGAYDKQKGTNVQRINNSSGEDEEPKEDRDWGDADADNEDAFRRTRGTSTYRPGSASDGEQLPVQSNESEEDDDIKSYLRPAHHIRPSTFHRSKSSIRSASQSLPPDYDSDLDDLLNVQAAEEEERWLQAQKKRSDARNKMALQKTRMEQEGKERRLQQKRETQKREQSQKEQREKAAREEREKAMRDKDEREKRENSIREKAEREKRETAIREKAEREKRETAIREKAEREKRETAIREKAEREKRQQVEKGMREKAENAMREQEKQEKVMREKAEMEKRGKSETDEWSKQQRERRFEPGSRPVDNQPITDLQSSIKPVSSPSPVKAAEGSAEERQMKLMADSNAVTLGFATIDVTDPKFKRRFGKFVDRQLDDIQVKKINTSYNADGVITSLEPIPIFVRPSHINLSSLTQDWTANVRAPRLEWTPAGLNYGVVDFLGARHRIAAVFMYIKEKRSLIAKFQFSLDKPKLTKDAAAHATLQAQIDEADRKIRFASRWLVVVINGDALEGLPNCTEVGQFISANRNRPYRGESDADGVLAVFKRLGEKDDLHEMFELLKTLRADASSRLKPLLWCHELVLFLRLMVRIPGLKWSPILDIKRFINPHLQNVHGGLFIHLLSRAINLMIDSSSRPYVTEDGSHVLDSPLLDLWPLQLLQKLDKPFKVIILPVFKLSGLLDEESVNKFQDAYRKYVAGVSRVVDEFWSAENAQADFNDREKEAVSNMVTNIHRHFQKSWKATPGMPIFLPTESYLTALVDQWKPMESATREIGHIIEPLSRNGVKTKGITHNHDTMLTIQRHLEASDRLDFDQSARDKFYYVFFTNRAIGLSRLAITVQNNPVPEAAVVQSNCPDFKHRLDVLNNKMTDSLGKTTKGGPRRGFDILDLDTVLEIRALDTTLQTWRESTNQKRDWPPRQKGALISTLQAQAYRPAVYSSPVIRQLRTALVKTINESCLEGNGPWAPWDEPIFTAVAEDMQDFDEVADKEELKSTLSNRQIISRQKRSIQNLVNAIQKSPEAQIARGGLDSDVRQALTHLAQVLETNASRLRWVELKRKGPWQVPSDTDTSEAFGIVIQQSASPISLGAPTEDRERSQQDLSVDGNVGYDWDCNSDIAGHIIRSRDVFDPNPPPESGRDAKVGYNSVKHRNMLSQTTQPAVDDFDIVLQRGEELAETSATLPSQSHGKQEDQLAKVDGSSITDVLPMNNKITQKRHAEVPAVNIKRPTMNVTKQIVEATVTIMEQTVKTLNREPGGYQMSGTRRAEDASKPAAKQVMHSNRALLTPQRSDSPAGSPSRSPPPPYDLLAPHSEAGLTYQKETSLGARVSSDPFHSYPLLLSPKERGAQTIEPHNPPEGIITFSPRERQIQYAIDDKRNLVYPPSGMKTTPEEVMYLALRVFRGTPALKPLLAAQRYGNLQWEATVTSKVQRKKIADELDQMPITEVDLDAHYSQPVLHQLQYWVDASAVEESSRQSPTFQNYQGHSTNVLAILHYQAHHPTLKVSGFRDFVPNGIVDRAIGIALARNRRKAITFPTRPTLSPTVIIATEPISPSQPAPQINARPKPRPYIPLGDGEEELSETSQFDKQKMRAWYNSRPSVQAARKKSLQTGTETVTAKAPIPHSVGTDDPVMTTRSMKRKSLSTDPGIAKRKKLESLLKEDKRKGPPLKKPKEAFLFASD